MARTACSEATELNSQRRDIHHPRSNRRMAETMMRQTRPQHQRGRSTRCSLMPKSREASRELASLVEWHIRPHEECGRQLERCRQGGGLPHEELGDCRSDDHKVIARVLAEE